MKIKSILFFAIILALFIPFVSESYILYPANLTIIVNTQEGDAFFHFNLDQYSINGLFRSEEFDVETQNLSGTLVVYPLPLGDDNLTQDIIPGFKIGSIVCISDNPDDVFLYREDGVKFAPVSHENIICTFNNVKFVEKTPILIVPGLVGTEMKKGDELLWIDLLRMFTDIGDEFMDDLQFNPNLFSADSGVVTGKVIKNPDQLFNYTESLINEFEGQGYVEGESLFTFPYDWRYGVSGVNLDGKTNSDLLGEKINEILQQTGAEKVDVVAHSMGGLVAKKYVMDNPGDNRINKAVFVGVPNTGAPKAVKGLLQGDNFGIPWLADSEIKKISANMPSAYDLLPSQEYYNVKGDSFIQVVNRTSLFTTEIKNLNYEESKSFLTNDHSLNSLAMDNAVNLHTEEFDDFDMRTAGVDVYSINGCKAGTLGKIVEVRAVDVFGGAYTTYNKPKEVPGDGTVPLESATNLPIDQNNKYYALSAEHGKLLSQNGIRQEIVNLIDGSGLNVSSNLITQDISQCQLNGRAISVFSPIDIFVTDQAGNKMGLADDGSLINEIPNADFQIWGEPSNPAGRHKFVYLPTDNGQIYSFGINGTGDGVYTIKLDNIQNNSVAQTEVFSNLPVTTALEGKISLSGGTTTLILDTNGDGVEDQTVQPSAVLDASQSDDLIPPGSIATIIGEQKKPGKKIISWLRGKKQNQDENVLQIEITAEDDNSGILSISYNLDNTGFQKIDGDKAELDVFGEGSHTITFFATDRSGNNETEQVLSFEIKENKNRLKSRIFDIKNLIYNKLKINIDQDKTKFPWKIRDFVAETVRKDMGLKDTNFLKNITSKLKFSWPW